MTRFMIAFVLAALAWPVTAVPVMADPAATQAVNALRQAQRQAPLTYSPRLEAAARAHAQDMAQRGFFSHSGSNGSAVSERIAAQGYGWCFAAENIAKGQRNLGQVMQSWTTSKGHYKNMVHPKVREFGLARAPGNIWVMVLAASGC